ncbi:MAG: SprB repeat-containing protein, partial [Bacteroidales bacterium]|nr:SprB repeat-containing protein [Bacteroidales bacterium]
MTYAYAQGVLQNQLTHYYNEYEYPYQIDKDKNTFDLNTTTYKDDQDRYHLNEALIQVDYEVFRMYPLNQNNQLCANSEIKFIFPSTDNNDNKNPLNDSYNLYYNNKLIKVLNSNDNKITVSDFATTLDPFSLVLKADFKNGNDFVEGMYITPQMIIEKAEVILSENPELILYYFYQCWNENLAYANALFQVILQVEDDIIKRNNESFNMAYSHASITRTIPTEISQTFHFKELQEDVPFDKPYILDDHLVIENTPNNQNCKFQLVNISVGHQYDGSKIIGDKEKGQYQIQIADKNNKYCQVNLNALFPKIEYAHINGSDSYTHWFNEDHTDAIKLYFDHYDTPDNEFLSLSSDSKYQQKHKNSDITPFYYKQGKSEFQEVDLYYEGEQIGTQTLYSTPYHISCYPDLDSIIIIPKDIEHSIYTIISTQNQGEETGKLQAYEKISVKDNNYNIKQPHCNYDDAVIKIKDIHNGLGLGDQDKYTFQVEGDDYIESNKDDEGVWSISVKNHELNTITLSIFDKDTKTEDTGRDFRAWSVSFPVNRPQPLYIPAPSISHPLCTGNSNGSIAINTADVKLSYDVEPIYTWYVKVNKETKPTTSIGLGPTISNLPAGFYQVELNNDNCIATGSYELIDPPLLEFESTTSSNAKCYGYSDGSIFTSVIGGTPGYKYSWNVGATSNNLLNIPKGKYKLTVLDAHKCQIQTDTIDISEPPQVINNNIAHDYSICQDSELEIDAGNFADYIWKNPQGKTLDAKNILTLNNSSPEGEYYLKTIRDDDCFAEDYINITQSKESLKMNFLIPSDIYNDDHAKIVETSSRELDSLKWSFSENLIGDFPKDSTTLTISTNALDKLSTYKIKLTGYYKGCVSTV